VQEDDDAFLAQIARRFYDVVGNAQRQADPNHLVFGDRYLAGDTPESVLKAATPWIDAVAVQPGDRYSPLYPPSTHFPEAEMDRLHAVTGKPVLICDHAISFPTAEHPRTIFEQMPNEAAAAKATADFLQAAFAKPYMLGYLRCQYIDRPANYGRGLRQGILRSDGTPRDAFVRVYREGFAAALNRLKDLAP
jgi:agarase